MTKYIKGQKIAHWRDFIEAVQRDKYFYFHDDLTTTQVVLGWQLATVLRYAEKNDGTLKYAEEQK